MISSPKKPIYPRTLPISENPGVYSTSFIFQTWSTQRKEAMVATTVDRMRSGKYHHCLAMVPSIIPLPAIVAIVFGTKNAVPSTVR
jgi:hypothetical protein